MRGAGTAFSSGFDLKEQMERRPQGVEQWRPLLRKDFDTIMRFWHCPLPTIAAVRGPCLAGACELALACDLTIASEDAFFGEPELKFGAGIVAMILPWIVGPKVAKEIILTGADRIGARARQEIGMINRIVPAAELDDAALTLAQHIAAIDPNLVKETKRAINRALESAEHAAGAGGGARHRPCDRRRRLARQDAVHGHRAPRRPEGRARLARCALSRQGDMSGALAELLAEALQSRDA